MNTERKTSLENGLEIRVQRTRFSRLVVQRTYRYRDESLTSTMKRSTLRSIGTSCSGQKKQIFPSQPSELGQQVMLYSMSKESSAIDSLMADS